MPSSKIKITGANTHNLNNVQLELKREHFTIFIGPSGSGKSSMAISTIFAEGQRRYLDSVSGFNRRLFGMLDAPDLDSASGIPPAICIESKRRIASPRSTLGTVTGLYDNLRSLFSRIGHPRAPTGESVLYKHSPREMLDKILAEPPEKGENRKLMLLAPCLYTKPASAKSILEQLESRGFIRVRLDGKILDLEELKKKKLSVVTRLDIVIDRLLLSKEKSSSTSFKKRLMDSLNLALETGNGKVIAYFPDEKSEILLNREYTDPETLEALPDVDLQTFSFNTKKGACPECKGTAIPGTGKSNEPGPAEPTEVCSTCGGSRLNDYARSIQIEGKNIFEICSMPLNDLQIWVSGLKLILESGNSSISKIEKKIGLPILIEFEKGVNTCCDLNLEYMNLARASNTLSMGETQKVGLISHLRGDLSGILYVLDEPSTGLHASEIDSVLRLIQKLILKGNSVIVCDHNSQFIQAADEIVEFGPGAGSNGGDVVFQGTYDQLKKCDSLTGDYLKGVKKISRRELNNHVARLFKTDKKPGKKTELKLSWTAPGAAREQSALFPLEKITAVTGISGSGKTNLVFHTLAGALEGTSAKRKNRKVKVSGHQPIQKLIQIDQSPIGRNSKSNLATYTGLFTSIRNIFCQTKDAKIRGYKANQFSFNHKKGQCPACKGFGHVTLPMEKEQLILVCEECEGKRFSPETLQILYKGKSIYDVLEMTVADAETFFRAFPGLVSKLTSLLVLGLGYLKMGQPAPTLSGGEAQRIKLASDLKDNREEKTLYLLDEPCTGLHLDDISKLVLVLLSLVEQGHTVVVIEQQQDFIKLADRVIEMGPGRGEAGGQVISQASQ